MKSCDENHHGWTAVRCQTVAFNHPKQKPNQSHWLEPSRGRARALSHVINFSRSQSVIESNDSSNLFIPSISPNCAMIHCINQQPRKSMICCYVKARMEPTTTASCSGQLRKLGNLHFIVFFCLVRGEGEVCFAALDVQQRNESNYNE